MDSYDVIAGAVRDYWKGNYPQDVVAFFRQKYSWDDTWERCEELVECHGSDDYESMTFLSDFCEGQTDVKDVVIIPLREVTAFYYKRKIENHESEPLTNGDRLRAKTDEELAEEMSVRLSEDCLRCPVLQADCPVWDETQNVECKDAMLNWLREESDNG